MSMLVISIHFIRLSMIYDHDGSQALLTLATTWSEIALGFLLIVLIVTPSRNLLLTFFYW
jgi:hypothetical protein